MPRFAEVFPCLGVDETAHWMMVPHRGFNVVLLRDGRDLRLSGGRNVRHQEVLKKDAVALAQAVDGRLGPEARPLFRVRLGQHLQDPGVRIFKITGVAPGSTSIHAVNRQNRTRATCDVSVRIPLYVPVVFHLVQHRNLIGGKVTSDYHSTNVSAALVDAIVEGANYILEPQVNISLVKEAVHQHRVNYAIVEDLRPGGDAATIARLAELRDPTALANVFFVHTIYLLGGPRPTSRGVEVGAGVVLVSNKDANAHYFRTVAHEALHVLGVPGELHGQPGHLFGPATDTQGKPGSTRIPKVLARHLNG